MNDFQVGPGKCENCEAMHRQMQLYKVELEIATAKLNAIATNLRHARELAANILGEKKP